MIYIILALLFFVGGGIFAMSRFDEGLFSYSSWNPFRKFDIVSVEFTKPDNQYSHGEYHVIIRRRSDSQLSFGNGFTWPVVLWNAAKKISRGGQNPHRQAKKYMK